MHDDLDEDDDKEEDNAPSSFGIIMLENAGNSPLSINRTICYHTILCILKVHKIIVRHCVFIFRLHLLIYIPHQLPTRDYVLLLTSLTQSDCIL